jgi:hypothetical protein
VKTDSASDPAFTARLYAIRRTTTGSLLNYSYTETRVSGSWTKVSAVIRDQSWSSTPETTVQCQLAPTSVTDVVFDVDRASVAMAGLVNASLEPQDSGWIRPNGPLAVYQGWGSGIEGSGYNYVSVIAQSPWASLAQDQAVGAGGHRCAIAVRAGSGTASAQVQLTIWNLTRGTSSDTKATLTSGGGWRELTATLDVPGNDMVSCEVYIVTANVRVDLDAAALT